MRTYLIVFSFFILLTAISCQESGNQSSKNKTQKEAEVNMNFGGELTEGNGISLSILRKDTIQAFGIYLPFHHINDSIIEIDYPLKPLETDANFLENSEDIEIGKWGTGTGQSSHTYSKKAKEIYFGSDLLKYKILENKRINIFFPKKSIWKIRLIKNGFEVYNEKRSLKYYHVIG